MNKPTVSVALTTYDKEFQSRFWCKVSKTDGCWEWVAYRKKSGHGVIWDGPYLKYAHRVSWLLAGNSIPRGLCVLHRCNNAGCVNPEHLYLGNKSDNHRDMMNAGTYYHPAGEKNGRAKLSRSLVHRARAMHRSGMTLSELSRVFNVSKSAIGYAVSGGTWK
jgi:hypothetical protein